ncbi:MAG: hypothetical protein HZA48_00025 [Planctomycetes bacterium]|nr:hypothetical protein [Planctomycetota bacterium]
MKTTLLKLAFIFLTALPAYSQTENTPGIKIEFYVTSKNVNNLFVYSYEGAANLPDGAILDCSVVFIKKVLHPNAPIPPSEKDFQDVYMPVASGKATVKNNAFKIPFGYLKKKPYSGRYMHTVTFDPEAQPAAVTEKLGSPAPTAVSCEKNSVTGTDIEYETERKEEEQRILNDFALVEKSLKEIDDKFKSSYLASSPDLTEWNSWLKNWQAGIDAIEKNNNSRFEEDYNLQESDARYFLGNMLDGMKDLKKLYSENLSKEPAQRDPYSDLEAEAREMLSAITRSKESLMLAKHIDKDKILGLINEVQKTVDAIADGKDRASSGTLTPDQWLELKDSTIRIFSKTITAVQSEAENEIPLTFFAGAIKNFNALAGDYSDIASNKKQPDKTTKKLEEALKKSIEALKSKL